jgi:MFS family permease
MTSRPWFVPLVVFLVVWVMTTHGKYSVSGDEPHYLIVTQSLWADGDIDVRNNHAANDSRRFGVDNLEPGPHVRESNGRQLPVHDIGLSVALVPIYAVATGLSGLVSEPLLARFRMSRGLFAYSLVTLSLLALTALAAYLTRRALLTAGASPGLAAGLVLVVWLSPPVLSNAYLVFPEVAALLTTASIVKRSTEAAVIPFGRWLAPLSLLGLLPWFHRKFIVYVAALAISLAWRHRDQVHRLRPAQWIAAIGLISFPTVLLLLWTWWQWGNIGGALTLDRPPFSWEAFRVGWLGLLVDRENGLWAWAPAYALLPLACALSGRAAWPWLVPVGALFLASASHDQWWGGFSPAARFLMPLAPIACLFAPALWRHPATRAVTTVAVAAQVVIAAYGWQVTRALWPQGDGHNRVVGPLLEFVGASESVLPALRVAPDTLGRALVLVAIGLAINLVLWFVVRGHETHLPSDASRHVG